jgi:3-oxoacyl-[acyl-carrier protein] reductase
VELRGKTAVVTGATGGLGWRICVALGSAGVNVCMVYHRSKEKAIAQQDELERTGVQSAIVQADVTTSEGRADMLSTARDRLGGVDILVLDAAYNEQIPFPDLTTLSAEKWDYILNFNLTSAYLAVRAAVPLMNERGGGRIVTISSIGGLQPFSSSIAYSVSKAGLVHLTRCLAVALAPDILVNDVAPGLLEGTRTTNALEPAHAEKARKAAILKRSPDKDDVANAVVMLCKTDSITGQTIVVDGGRVFR